MYRKTLALLVAAALLPLSLAAPLTSEIDKHYPPYNPRIIEVVEKRTYDAVGLEAEEEKRTPHEAAVWKATTFDGVDKRMEKSTPHEAAVWRATTFDGVDKRMEN